MTYHDTTEHGFGRDRPCPSCGYCPHCGRGGHGGGIRPFGPYWGETFTSNGTTTTDNLDITVSRHKQ